MEALVEVAKWALGAWIAVVVIGVIASIVICWMMFKNLK